MFERCEAELEECVDGSELWTISGVVVLIIGVIRIRIAVVVAIAVVFVVMGPGSVSGIGRRTWRQRVELGIWDGTGAG